MYLICLWPDNVWFKEQIWITTVFIHIVLMYITFNNSQVSTSYTDNGNIQSMTKWQGRGRRGQGTQWTAT